MVSRYIVVPSRAAGQATVPQTEPSTAGRMTSADDAPAKKVALGTGGTKPVEVWKQVRNEIQETVLQAEEC